MRAAAVRAGAAVGDETMGAKGWILLLGVAVSGLGCGGAEGPGACVHEPGAYQGLPTIAGMAPAFGPPGTTVVLTGRGFDVVDDRYVVAYGDFSAACDYATLEGRVLSDAQIEVVIPEDATLPGHLYLLAEGLTVARAPARFDLERDVGVVVVDNRAQFPVVTVHSRWEPIMEPGDRVDVEERRAFEVPAGALHLEVCVGGVDGGAADPWSCQVYDGRMPAGHTVPVTVAPVTAAHVLEGRWRASWEVGEEVHEEDLFVADEGYWELRYGGRVVESGTVLEPAAWPPYTREFTFALRPDDPRSEARLPLRSFAVQSPRAGDVVTFYRAAE